MGDDRFKPITHLTFPRIRKYAETIDADLHIISTRVYPDVNICYEKFQMRGVLDSYERIAYVDGDVLIRPHAKNIFDAVPIGSFGAMNEAQYIHLWSPERALDQLIPHGWIGPWNGVHFNAGVMVFDQSHKRLFENPHITNIPFWDQPLLNVRVNQWGIPYHRLAPEFNFLMFHYYWNPKDLRSRAYFLHFADGYLDVGRKATAISKEISTWTYGG